MVCIIVLPPTFFLPREKKRKGVTVRDRVRKNNDGVVLRTFCAYRPFFSKGFIPLQNHPNCRLAACRPTTKTNRIKTNKNNGK